VPGPQGESIEATIPLIPTLPNTPDAAIVEMTATLGTRSQSYFRTVGGRRMRFTPKGATLPGSCPAGGWPFSATFGFGDGTSASAAAAVGCSGKAERRHGCLGMSNWAGWLPSLLACRRLRV